MSFQVQYDQWKVRTAQQASVASSIAKDGRYTFREDVKWNSRTGRVTSAPLWAKGVATTKVMTLSINVPTNATPAQVLNAEKAATARYFHVNANKAATVKAGHTLSTAWVIPAGAWNDKTSWKVGPRTGAQLLAGSIAK